MSYLFLSCTENLLLDTMDYVVGFHGFIAQEGVLGEFIEQMQAMD